LLVVCLYYNQIYLTIQERQKNKKIVEKVSESAHQLFVYFSQVMTSYQENITKQPVECWMLTTDCTTTQT